MQNKFKTVAAVAAVTCAALGVARAQTASTYDPAQLPALRGKVAQYSLTPRGDVDGLILDDGTEVHMPPHLGTQLAFAVQPGDAVTVRGLKARAAPMVQALSVQNDKTGRSVADTGKDDGPGGGASTTRQGRIKAQLHGAQGEVNGVLFDDGTIVRLPPHEATRLAATLAAGQTIAVAGRTRSTAMGTVIAADAVGSDPAQLVRFDPPARDRRGPPPPPDRP